MRMWSLTGYVFQEFFVLNRVRVSNPQRLTYTQILVEYLPHPPFPGDKHEPRNGIKLPSTTRYNRLTS